MTVHAFGEPEPYVRVTVTVEVPGEPTTAITYPRCRDLSFTHIPEGDHPVDFGPLLLAVPPPPGREASVVLDFTAVYDQETGATHILERRPVDAPDAPGEAAAWPGGWSAERAVHEGPTGE